MQEGGTQLTLKELVSQLVKTNSSRPQHYMKNAQQRRNTTFGQSKSKKRYV
jgi:hypothetical protein